MKFEVGNKYRIHFTHGYNNDDLIHYVTCVSRTTKTVTLQSPHSDEEPYRRKIRVDYGEEYVYENYTIINASAITNQNK